SRRLPYALVAAAAILPRLGVLVHERGTITAAYVDKGDVFARTFLANGTYGFIPGRPSAYTQPLYGWFLIPLYWIFERSWVVVGNVRLVLLPLVVGAFVLVARRPVLVVATLAAAAVVVTPWVVRNRASVGCTTLTTDGRALWKANNPNTLRTLEHGKWIDDV